MPTKRRSRPSLATKAAELSIAAPQVVAHRLTRMASSGPVLSARDRKEFTGMVNEKSVAFTQSWIAMANQSMVAWQRLSASLLQSFWFPWLGARMTPAAMAGNFRSATLQVLDKGLAPVHRKAVSNARRLSHTRIR